MQDILSKYCTALHTIATGTTHLTLNHLNSFYSNKLSRKGYNEIHAKVGVCVVYLDMWPVNLTQITKDHVRDNCPGMVIRYVPAGGTGRFQVGDTDLHYPYKAAIKLAFYSWYSLSAKALQKRRLEELITAEEYKVSLSLLLSMGVLRDEAPVWAHAGIANITDPRHREGMITRFLYIIYTEPV